MAFKLLASFVSVLAALQVANGTRSLPAAQTNY